MLRSFLSLRAETRVSLEPVLTTNTYSGRREDAFLACLARSCHRLASQACFASLLRMLASQACVAGLLRELVSRAFFTASCVFGRKRGSL
jgi:hypothetical protein